VFSLSAKEEVKRKPLFGAKNRATGQFFDLLINKTSQLVSTIGADVIWFDENKQQGHDFSSRITQAFSDLFAQGYEKVISIGNDSPDLTIAHIETALQQLEENELVLGPSADGGVYLIGIHKSHFNATVFETFPWQQENLFAELVADAHSHKRAVSFLGLLNDLDTAEDVFAYAKINTKSFIYLFIEDLIGQKQAVLDQLLLIIPSQKCRSIRALRAPPYQIAA
jgi:glycosyltransferase A (GT-A) superfamily protein (DUF2064 family)